MPSIAKVTSTIGALVGFGFGIYAARENFNADAHQAASMEHATKVFSEILLQVGHVALY